MKNKELVRVGIFGQPHGLKGDIKINIFISSLESFKLLDRYFMKDGTSEWVFVSLRKVGKIYIGSLQGYEDRNAVKELNGKSIFASRKKFPKINDNEYYAVDLIGCEVINIKKEILGCVINVQNFGAGDLIEIKNQNQKKFYIPANKDNIVSTNIQKKIIIVDPMSGLLD